MCDVVSRSMLHLRGVAFVAGPEQRYGRLLCADADGSVDLAAVSGLQAKSPW